jgi:hypothetical protein
MIYLTISQENKELLNKYNVVHTETAHFNMLEKDFYTILLPINYEWALDILNKQSLDTKKQCVQYCSLEVASLIIDNCIGIEYLKHSTDAVSDLLFNSCRREDDNPEMLDYLLKKFNCGKLPDYNIYAYTIRFDNTKIFKYLLDNYQRNIDDYNILRSILWHESIEGLELFFSGYVSDIDPKLFSQIIKTDSDSSFFMQMMEVLIELDNSGKIPNFNPQMNTYLRSINNPCLTKSMIDLGFIEN